MQLSLRVKGILFSIAAALIWSTGGLFVKLLPLNAYTILFYRSIYTAIFFLLVFRLELTKINKFSIMAAMCYVPLMLCFVVATKMTTAANAIFLQSTGVVYVLLLEPFFRKTKMLRIDVLTVILCFIGMAVLLINDFKPASSNLGLFIAMFSGMASAAVIIIQKMNTDEYRPSGILLGNFLIVLITIPWFIESPYPDFKANTMLMFLGFVQLGLGFIFFIWGQKYIAAIDSALISLLEPLFNPIWVVIGYGEIPGIVQVAGGLMILSSLVFRSVYLYRKKLL